MPTNSRDRGSAQGEQPPEGQQSSQPEPTFDSLVRSMQQLMVDQSIPRGVADEIRTTVQQVIADAVTAARPESPTFPNSRQVIPTGPWAAFRSTAVNGRVHIVIDTFGKRYTDPLPWRRDDPFVGQTFADQKQVAQYNASDRAPKVQYDAWMECDNRGNCPLSSPSSRSWSRQPILCAWETMERPRS